MQENAQAIVIQKERWQPYNLRTCWTRLNSSWPKKVFQSETKQWYFAALKCSLKLWKWIKNVESAKYIVVVQDGNFTILELAKVEKLAVFLETF